MSHADPDLDGQVAQICRAVTQLQGIVGQLISRPPVRMTVQHMDVAHLAFNVAGIDVEELSGQLNLGLTHLFQVDAGAREQPGPGTEAGAPGAGTAPAPAGEAPPVDTRQLWPPAAMERGIDE
jgi:hypothetical protein